MTLRRRGRYALDRLARASGLMRLLESAMRGSVTVLTYHRILPDEACREYPFPAMAMPVTAFRDQVRWLVSRFRLLPLGESLEALRLDGAGRPPIVSLTFDDGYRDNATTAAEILHGIGVRATFFVVAGHIGVDQPLWFDRAAHVWSRAGSARLRDAVAADAPGVDASIACSSRRGWVELLKRLPPARREVVLMELQRDAGAPCPESLRLMDGDDLRSLAGDGHEIGSHALTHSILTGLDDEALRREVAGSRSLLEELLGRPVRGFCYPNGDFDARVAGAVRSAGYDYAAGTRPVRNGRGSDRFALGRIDVTAHAVCDPDGSYDELSFRGEVCLFHGALR